jgi:hypothetical protein
MFPYVGGNDVGAYETGARLVGGTVVGPIFDVGAAVTGANVAGARVVGAIVTGANVVPAISALAAVVAVGIAVCAFVGGTAGAAVGSLDGETVVGAAVGSLDGDTVVGVTVGSFEGDTVVGASVSGTVTDMLGDVVGATDDVCTADTGAEAVLHDPQPGHAAVAGCPETLSVSSAQYAWLDLPASYDSQRPQYCDLHVSVLVQCGVGALVGDAVGAVGVCVGVFDGDAVGAVVGARAVGTLVVV